MATGRAPYDAPDDVDDGPFDLFPPQRMEEPVRLSSGAPEPSATRLPAERQRETRVPAPRKTSRRVAESSAAPEIAGVPAVAPSYYTRHIPHSAAGVVLGMLGYALGICYLRYGWAGVRGWFDAKFFNKPFIPPAGTTAQIIPLQSTASTGGVVAPGTVVV